MRNERPAKSPVADCGPLDRRQEAGGRPRTEQIIAYDDPVDRAGEEEGDMAAPARVEDEFEPIYHHYTPHRAGLPPLVPYFRELWSRREFAAEMSKATLRGANVNTVFGQLWLILNPLLMAGVYYLLVTIGTNAQVLMTYVPPRPAFPPEAVWLREDQTDIAGLVVNERVDGTRIAYLAADLDRRYARDNISDSGNLLANIVRWSAGDDIPLTVEGPGLLDCHLYQQPGRLILHIVNLTNEGTWRGPIDELIPVGPIRVGVRLREDVRGSRVHSLVTEKAVNATAQERWLRFELPAILDHEVLVIE